MKKNIEIVPNIQKLFGTRDENLQIMEDGLKVTIDLKPESVQIEGPAREVARAEQIFTDFDQLSRTGQDFSPSDLNSMLRVVAGDATTTLRGLAEADQRWKPASVSVFCREHCRRRSIPIFVRCMTLSMTSWTRNASIVHWRRM